MDYKHLKSNIINFFFIGVIVIFTSCKKEDISIIPETEVYYELSMTRELAKMGVGAMLTITTNPENNDFSIIDYHNGSAKYSSVWKTRGNGILLYRRSSNEYQAFDLTCTYNAFKDYCAVKVENGNTSVTCPCCGSIFLLSADGLPTSDSKAVRPLVQYKVNYDGLSMVISN